MTTIAVFSTFTNRHDSYTLKKENLDNFYMLSDSQLSIIKDDSYIPYNNKKKIFYDKNSSVVMGIAGLYDIGKTIISLSLKNISQNNNVIKATSLDQKIDAINTVIKEVVQTIHTNSIKYNTTIICNTVHDRNFRTVKFHIKKNSKLVYKTEINPMERIAVTHDGMDGELFEKYRQDFEDTLPKYLSSATKYFRLFIKFLYSDITTSSGPPCQSVVLNKQGKIKELSIKHPDNNFYKMGILHHNRVIRIHEIDYRDSDFNFLSRSKIN